MSDKTKAVDIKLYSVAQPITITPYRDVEAVSPEEALNEYQKAVINDLHSVFDVVQIDIPEDNGGLELTESVPC
jgi:hypothetical protein